MLPIKKVRGLTYIEIIVAVGILGILSASLFTLISSSYQITSFISARTDAIHLAQEKIELVKNLNYEDVGTQGGIPDGAILQNETIMKNSLPYNINTIIAYIDDPFDGTFPDDDSADYKKVTIQVSWEGLAGSGNNPVTFITNVAPPAEEDSVGGTLSILVNNAYGQPIIFADVSIIANELLDPVDLNLQTDADGQVLLLEAEICNNCYQITVSKEGYSTDKTYSAIEVANPVKPHASVLENELTEVGFTIDLVSTLQISIFGSRVDEFPSLSGVDFTLTGGKIIGIDDQDNAVFKYQEVHTSDESGIVEIQNLEWDNYYFFYEGETYNFAGSNPLNPFLILPDKQEEFKVSLNSSTLNNLFLTFINVEGASISSVSATLTGDPDYVEEIIAGMDEDSDFGQVFFPDLEVKTYELIATASGYIDHSSQIDVDEIVSEIIILNR